MQLVNKTIEVKKENDVTLKLYVRKHEDNKMLGFVSVSVHKGETFSHAYNDLQVIDGKDGIFLVEPNKSYQDKKTQEWKKNYSYIMPKAIKEDITSIINSNFK